MTGDELKAWRDRMGYSNQEAADRLALSLRGFHDQLYGHRKVSRRTMELAALIEQHEGPTLP